MADELKYYGAIADTGLTITSKVYDASGAQVGSDVSYSEVGSLAIYLGDMPTAAAGKYTIRIFSSSTLVSTVDFVWDGSAEITLQTVQSTLDAAITASQEALEITFEDAALLAR